VSVGSTILVGPGRAVCGHEVVAEDSDSAEVHWGDEKRGLRVVLELLSFWFFFFGYFLSMWMLDGSEWVNVERKSRNGVI
jgi:hypothetical protein